MLLVHFVVSQFMKLSDAGISDYCKRMPGCTISNADYCMFTRDSQGLTS